MNTVENIVSKGEIAHEDCYPDVIGCGSVVNMRLHAEKSYRLTNYQRKVTTKSQIIKKYTSYKVIPLD